MVNQTPQFKSSKAFNFQTTCLFLICLFISFSHAFSENLHQGRYIRQINPYPYDLLNLTVIGKVASYVVKDDDTFLDIARKHELGINEMIILYPGTDPWMPPPGKTLAIPACWVLPPTKLEQLVINIPEMRLYVFHKENAEVQTYPVGIGSEGWKTPEGNFYIMEKRFHPKWYVPESLQEEYGLAIMPPGPDNPLGKYIMRFADSSYGIHGTHMPWGVGRLISHGCIRCYPEHIRLLYPQVPLGTKVEVVYEPVKFGIREGRIYVEVHPDVYAKIPDFNDYASSKLKNSSWSDRVDLKKYRQAVLSKDGVPTDITLSREKTRKKGDWGNQKPPVTAHTTILPSECSNDRDATWGVLDRGPTHKD